jgi:hypothetical protein
MQLSPPIGAVSQLQAFANPLHDRNQGGADNTGSAESYYDPGHRILSPAQNLGSNFDTDRFTGIAD